MTYELITCCFLPTGCSETVSRVVTEGRNEEGGRRQKIEKACPPTPHHHKQEYPPNGIELRLRYGF